MAKSNGDVGYKMLAELQQLNAGVAGLKAELSGKIDELRGEMRGGFERLDKRIDQTNGRLDHLIDLTGTTYREHEQRLKAIEERLGIQPGH